MDELGIINSRNMNGAQALQQAQRVMKNNPDQQKLREVASEFESLFVKEMLNSMRETLNAESRLVDGGLTEEVFEDMLYDEYSKNMVKRNGFGIADIIVEQYSKQY